MQNIISLPALIVLMAGIITSLSADDSLPYQKEPFDDLLVAGQPTLGQLEQLADKGFTTIINLRAPGEFDDFDEAVKVEQLGMRYVHIPLKILPRSVPQMLQRSTRPLPPPPVLSCCTAPLDGAPVVCWQLNAILFTMLPGMKLLRLPLRRI